MGRLENLILNVDSGQVEFAVISFGGWFGLGRKLRAVPSAMVTTSTSKLDIAALDCGRRRWDHAPLFKNSDLSKLEQDPKLAEALYQYYARSSAAPHRRGAADDSLVRQTTASSSKKTDPEQSPSSNGHSYLGNLEFATHLMRRPVIDRRGEQLGKISDLLVDLQGMKPTLAVLSRAKPLSKSRLFAVSLSALKVEQVQTLRIDATIADFTEAPPFDNAAWENFSLGQSIVIFRFPENDFTSIFPARLMASLHYFPTRPDVTGQLASLHFHNLEEETCFDTH